MNDKDKSTIPEIEALSDDALADVAGGQIFKPAYLDKFNIGAVVQLAPILGKRGNFQCHNCASTRGSGNQRTGIVYHIGNDSLNNCIYRLRCPVCNSDNLLGENGEYEFGARYLNHA